MKALSRRLAERTGIDLNKAAQVVGSEWLRREVRRALDELYESEGDGSTWEPRADLAELWKQPDADVIADGVLVRDDDAATLFPRGLLHFLFGQSEAGKSWLATEIIRQELERGGRALYLDFEDDWRTFRRRLKRDMRVDHAGQWLAEGRLGYANPYEAMSPAVADRLIARNYGVVVIDSLAEVVAATKDGSLRDGVLLRRVLRVFRSIAEAGAAVIIVAHASEKSERPETTLGASEQKQAITGQEVLLHNVDPLGRGSRGSSLIYITKDRQGSAAEDVTTVKSSSRVRRRLWGRMEIGAIDVLTPDGYDDGQRTVVTVVSAEQAAAPGNQTKLDRAERAVIHMLNEKGTGMRVADLIVDVSTAEQINPRRMAR